MKIYIEGAVVSLMILSCNDSGVEKTQNTKDTPKEPNILFIMSDDHAYQAISAYDSSLINTPNIDRLAKEGILFSNACVTNSICAPSRAVILTGKHCHINGKIDNRMPFDTTQVTFPQIMQKKGYQTAIFGKLHFGNNPKGADQFMILPEQGNYINPDLITNRGDTTITGYATDIITDLTIDWLKNRRKQEEPFMLMCLHKAPHRPWWPRADKFREYSKKNFPEPPTLFDDYKNRGTAARSTSMHLMDLKYDHDSKVRPEILEEMGNIKPENKSWPNAFYGPYGRANQEQKAEYDPVIDSISNFFKENWKSMTKEEKMRWKYQRYMQDYMACISSVDDNIGRLLDYLDESGLSKNTIVVYTSDQGFFLGEHGWFDKRFIYNESFKTPLLIRWPGVVTPGTVNHELVQNLDFAQTFLDAAGIKVPDDMQGESLMPLLKGENDKWKRDAVYYHYYAHPGGHDVKRHYGIVTKDYKLVHFYFDIDEWELYDRKKDPLEMNNVYNNPEYQEVVNLLNNKLLELRKKYKDSRDLDERFIQLYKQHEIYRNIK